MSLKRKCTNDFSQVKPMSRGVCVCVCVCMCVCVCGQSLSYVQLFATAWTRAHQAPLSMGFSRKEHWSVLPLPSPEYCCDPGIEPTFPVSLALAGEFLTMVPTEKT